MLLLSSPIVFGLPTTTTSLPQPVPLQHSKFDLEDASQFLSRSQKQLSQKKHSAEAISQTITELNKIKTQATQCVEETKSELSKLAPLESTATDIKPNGQSTESTYLKEKKMAISKKAATCQSIVIQSNETIAAFDVIAKQISTRVLLSVKTDLWKKIKISGQLLQEIKRNFDRSLFWKTSGLLQFKISIFRTGLITTFVFFCLLLLLARRFLFQLKLFSESFTFLETLQYATIHTLRRYVLLFGLGTILLAFFGIQNLIDAKFSLMTMGSLSLLAYTLLLMLNHFFFYAFSPAQTKKTLSGLLPHIAAPLKLRIDLLLSLCFLGSLVYIVLQNQSIPLLAIELSQTIFTSFLAISLINILWLINRIPKILKSHALLRIIVSIFLTAILSLVLLAEWFGYQPLAHYILIGISLSLVFAFVAYLLQNILYGFIHWWWQNKLTQALNLAKTEGLLTIFLLHATGGILVWGSFILSLLKIWGLSDTRFQLVLNGLINGFQVAGMRFVPVNILSAMLLLAIGLVFVRWLKNFFENRKNLVMGEGAQAAIATVIAYIGNSFVIIFALLLAGVQFSELAILAGALSVGIGFGLQKVVNNFISGIILLLEQPIKPGDRIRIGDIEGFVKKIRIRYTQIQTLSFHDLIVPNSEITSKPVTNLTFGNFYGKSIIVLRVTYGTDPHLVKKLLLDIAEAHPDVIKNPTRKPGVYLTEMNENGLKFELYCPIRHVNLNYDVLNDLHFKIEEAFRENKIQLVHPPRDIYIKSLPQSMECIQANNLNKQQSDTI
jgi:small-conductance mechanosensitive channel